MIGDLWANPSMAICGMLWLQLPGSAFAGQTLARRRHFVMELGLRKCTRGGRCSNHGECNLIPQPPRMQGNHARRAVLIGTSSRPSALTSASQACLLAAAAVIVFHAPPCHIWIFSLPCSRTSRRTSFGETFKLHIAALSRTRCASGVGRAFGSSHLFSFRPRFSWT